MGMFDELIIDSKKLPVSEEEKDLLKNKVFQTKSLRRGLLFYAINDNDELILLHIKDLERGIIPWWKGYTNNNGEILPDNPDIIKMKTPFHGFITFHTSVNNVWYEFKAKFTDGKMIAIEKVVEQEYL